MLEVVQTESGVPELIVWTRGGAGGGGGLLVATAGGFTPAAPELEPAMLGLEAVPLGGAPVEPDAEPAGEVVPPPVFGLAGKPEAEGTSELPGLPGLDAAIGVGLVVATLFDAESFEEQADCIINKMALKPASKTVFPNRDLIKPSQVCKPKLADF